MNKTVALYVLASVMVLAGGVSDALAQTPATPAATPAVQQPSMPAAPAAPAMTATPAAPAAAPVAASPAPAAPVKAAMVAKPHLSACARAIRVTEHKLDSSTADAKAIAAAWQHLDEAKKAKGAACQEHAKQAADLL